jgi:drug/metabolite transporter (DMT)-like permease
VGICIATGLGRHSAAVKSVGTLTVGALYLVPLSLIFESPWTVTPSALSVGAIVLLAIVATGIAAIAYFHLIATAGGAYTALSGYLTPVVAVVAGAILLGEDISARAVLALAIILIGVALASRRGRVQALAPPT